MQPKRTPARGDGGDLEPGTIAGDPRRLARAVRASSDALWEIELDSGLVYLSETFFALIGSTGGGGPWRQARWFEQIHPDDAERVRAAVDRLISGELPRLDIEYRLRAASGALRWVLCRGAAEFVHGRPVRLSGVLTDITERKAIEQQLLHDAMHDALTGLANRTLFLDRLAQRLARWQAERHPSFAVLFLDLDRFKVVNDSLGHLTGDQLLQEVARRLREALPAQHMLARLGGDEFTVLLEDIRDAGEAGAIAERLAEELRQPFRLAGQDVFPSASMGIAMCHPGYQEAGDMLRDADAAMYRAKARGRAQAVVFDGGMHTSALTAFRLEHELRAAVQRCEFLMYYQPIVRLATRKLVAFETLVRWRHPARGLVTAEEFMPMAEETGLIVAIDEWMIRSALRQAREWFGPGAFHSGLAININLSPASLLRPGFADLLHEMLREVRIDSRRINLELTERMLVESTTLSETAIQRLRSLSVGFCLDDFGIGYSSLSYLARFPITQLKIDGSFIKQMNTTDRHQMIIGTIIRLARNLGITVIAEGVELEAQARELQAMGCHYGQGYLFAPPLDAEAADRLVQQSKLAAAGV